MKKVIAAVVLSIASIPAQAWGPAEQAALAAIAGGFLIGRATAEPAPPPVHYAYPPRVTYEPQYYAPRHRRQCFKVPLYDAYGRYVRTTTECHYVH